MRDLLEVETVVKSYQSRKILTDIYLTCATGDILGIFGRNGSGKSTLLKIIFGTLSAENKFIRINDQAINKPYLKKDLIKYLPQSKFLPGDLTVKQAVGIYFKDPGVILSDEILSKVTKTKITNLSGGEERYLEIKMLLFSDAKFVLLDEPFNHVSPILVRSIKNLIIQQSHCKGIILTDHDYRSVLDVANKKILLVNGALKKIKDDSDLMQWGYTPVSPRRN